MRINHQKIGLRGLLDIPGPQIAIDDGDHVLQKIGADFAGQIFGHGLVVEIHRCVNEAGVDGAPRAREIREQGREPQTRAQAQRRVLEHAEGLIEVERVGLFRVVGDAGAHFRIRHQPFAKAELGNDIPHVLVETEQPGRAGIFHKGTFHLLGHAAAGNVLRLQNRDLIPRLLEVIPGDEAGNARPEHHDTLRCGRTRAAYDRHLIPRRFRRRVTSNAAAQPHLCANRGACAVSAVLNKFRQRSSLFARKIAGTGHESFIMAS